MKVALVFEGDLLSGGGYQQQLSTILALNKNDSFECVVIVFSKENLACLNDLGVSAIYFQDSVFSRLLSLLCYSNFFSFVRFYLKIRLKFEKALQSNNIDLVYFLSPNSLACDLISTNYIFTVWDLCHVDMLEFPEVGFNGVFQHRERLYIQAIKKAVAVITDSQTGKRNIIKRYGIDEHRVHGVSFKPSIHIHNKMQIDIKDKYGLKNKYYIYYPAQFWSHKNHVYFIDALVILKKNNILIDVIFSGSDKGNLDYVLQYAKHKQVDELVHYIGFAPNEELFSLYKNALAVVMPTYFGPTNIPPLEAFAIGTPVIYSNLPSFREQCGRAALYCDLTNPESLVKHLMALLENQHLSTQLIEAGKVQLDILNKQSNTAVVITKILVEYRIKQKCWKAI